MNHHERSLAVVFDFGGVLIDWSPYHLYRKLLPNDEEIRAFLEEIGFATSNPRLDAGYPFVEWVKECSRKFPQRRELIEAFFTRWTECSGKVIQGTLNILYELKYAGYPLYGLSNWSVESFTWVKDRYPFVNDLDDYLLSGMVRTVKPGEEIFRVFLERVGRNAQECVFVDDAQANIDTAKSLGFLTILYSSPGQLRETLESMEVLDRKFISESI